MSKPQRAETVIVGGMRFTETNGPTLDIAALTRYLGAPDSDQSAVWSWTGETYDPEKRWTEQEAAELREIWEAGTA